MDFLVKVNDRPHKATIVFAGLSDLQFVDRWRETLGTTPTPLQKETVDLANLARDRFIADSMVGQPYVALPGEIRDHIARAPACEVAGFVLLKCDWFPPSNVLGFCHFRRTWCNNLALDYLGKHPLTFGGAQQSQGEIGGIGVALLCFLSRIGVDLSCDQIWGEATETSSPFYKRLFKLESVRDLFLIPEDKFSGCAERQLDWQAQPDLNAQRMEAAKEVFEAEADNPPLVGNRRLVVASKRQLIDHFLDLSRTTQDEIAQALGLLNEGDDAILEDQWCGLLFQRAARSGKLRELWHEVEKRHEHGQPENNPFGT